MARWDVISWRFIRNYNIASIWFSKKNNHNTFKYLDVVSIVAPIGIFFGRIANFINSELYGTETNLPWAVKFIQS